MTHPATPQILIVGATGKIGGELTSALLTKGVPFRVLVRKAGAVQQLSSADGVDVVQGDLTDAASVLRAAEGMEKAFLLTDSSEGAEALQTGFVDAAKEAGVRHMVKLSQWAASAASPVRFLRYHAAVEEHIRRSGMDYTFLRPNLFMQGMLAFREPIIRQGKFFAAVGDAKISVVDIRDIAAVAAEALTGPGHEGKVYALTGPEALTHEAMAAKISTATGREVRFVDVSPGEMRQALDSAGFPAWQAEGLIEDYAHYAAGEAAEVRADVAQVTGRDARSFDAFARDYAGAFSE